MGNLKQHRDNFLFSVQSVSPLVNINPNLPESENNITSIVTTEGETPLTSDIVRKWFPNFNIWNIPGLQSYPGYPIAINNTQQTAETVNGEAPLERLEPRVAIPTPLVPANSLRGSSTPSKSPSEENNESTGIPKFALNIPESIIPSALKIADNIIYKEKGFSAEKWKQIAEATDEQLNNFSESDKHLFVKIYRLAVQDTGGYAEVGGGLDGLRNR
jgi:hypothetical protein